MKKSIESFIKLLRRKPKTLFFTCILAPIGISMMGVSLEWLSSVYFSNFISLLSSMYTIVSLLLVFLLLKQYSHPDFVMEKTNLDYLNQKALFDLYDSLSTIEEAITGENNVLEDYKKSIRTSKHIDKLLRESEEVSKLSPIHPDLKNVISNVNKYHGLRLKEIENKQLEDKILEGIFSIQFSLERLKEAIEDE
ncbi:hypothetical protein [Bacillus altitudinis]|uniref:hypothetical protein n=1 Tax=Bacillus altitudinis TaxID=293387 RepID=UPI002DBA3CFA|nr:hypothetical protein [Bacillus altitudinis]MEC0969375.1 hypothetical protein [Bacillus altitudinis]MEC1001939.1 hypothetical protein [Bacillus altitudinis]